MSPELERKLIEQYPAQFTGTGKPPGESNMAFGLECDDGWYPIIEEVCAIIDDQGEPVVWTQIKEKYGGLRMYGTGGSELVDGVVHMAESMSYRTCERCGNPGKPNDAGWIVTLCETCREG